MTRRKGRNAAARARMARATPFESSRLREIAVLLVVLKIAGLILLFDPASAHPFDGAKTAFSHATSWMLVGLLVVIALRYDLGPFARRRMHLVVGAVVLTGAISIIGALDRYTALFGTARHLGFTYLLDMATLYVGTALLFCKRRDWAYLGIAVGATGALAIMYGFLQYAGLDPIDWVADTRVRPPSTFGNPDKFGHFLGASSVAALGAAIFARDVDRRVRWGMLAYALAALGASAVVASRANLLGVVLALPVIAATVLARYGLSSKAVMRIGGAAVAALAIGVLFVYASPFGDRIRNSFDVGIQQRLFIAEATGGAFRERPLAGFGLDNFGAVYPLYRPEGSVAAAGVALGQDSAHSWLFQSLATTGLLGLVAVCVFVAASFYGLWRASYRSADVAVPLLAAAAAYWGTGLVSVGSVSVDWIPWLAAGGAVALTAGTPPPPLASRPRLALERVAIGAALVAALTGYWAFQANREAQTALAARSSSRLERSVAAAERAVQLDGGRAEYWYILGLAQQDRRAWVEAASAFRDAVDRTPSVSVYWSNLGLSLANVTISGRGDHKAEALAAARRGIEGDPFNPQGHHAYAVVANALGEYTEAIEASLAALRLYKGEPQYETVAADAAVKLDDRSAGRVALLRLIDVKDAAVLHVALSRVLLNLGDVEGARREVLRALEIDPQNGPALEFSRQLGITLHP